jgi:hypothetical protein
VHSRQIFIRSAQSVCRVAGPAVSRPSSINQELSTPAGETVNGSISTGVPYKTKGRVKQRYGTQSLQVMAMRTSQFLRYSELSL